MNWIYASPGAYYLSWFRPRFFFNKFSSKSSLAYILMENSPFIILHSTLTPYIIYSLIIYIGILCSIFQPKQATFLFFKLLVFKKVESVPLNSLTAQRSFIWIYLKQQINHFDYFRLLTLKSPLSSLLPDYGKNTTMLQSCCVYLLVCSLLNAIENIQSIGLDFFRQMALAQNIFLLLQDDSCLLC